MHDPDHRDLHFLGQRLADGKSQDDCARPCQRGAPFTTAGFARMVERVGAEARLGFKVHPHMLRHACGYALANRGHDTRALQAYLGHKNIQHTVRYTELSATRFKDFWRM
ncbi:MAG: tyrosine-type recombinase/integrase [Xanthobacteraceae bacterium]